MLFMTHQLVSFRWRTWYRGFREGIVCLWMGGRHLWSEVSQWRRWEVKTPVILFFREWNFYMDKSLFPTTYLMKLMMIMMMIHKFVKDGPCVLVAIVLFLHSRHALLAQSLLMPNSNFYISNCFNYSPNKQILAIYNLFVLHTPRSRTHHLLAIGETNPVASNHCKDLWPRDSHLAAEQHCLDTLFPRMSWLSSPYGKCGGR